MKAYFCDHCGKVLDVKIDHVNVVIFTPISNVQADLCKMCKIELDLMMESTIKDFCNTKGANNHG